MLLLSQLSMIEFCRKIHTKGGIVIGNGTVFTRSIANEKHILFDNEVASGPQLHTAPTITALRSSSSGALSEQGLYLDMLDKLSWGEGFIYYNDRIPLTTPLLTARTYPITFEQIRAGMIRGPQRIVTMNPGIYGWPGKRELHLVHKFDDLGVPVAHDLFTTVDSDGVRTELALNKNESAVIEPIPAALETAAPTSIRVLKYDDGALKAVLNGQGQVALKWFVGPFTLMCATGSFRWQCQFC